MVEYCNRFSGDFCLSVRLSVSCNPPMLNGKGRLRESTHLRYAGQKGIVEVLPSGVVVCSCCPSVFTWLLPQLHD